MSHLGSRILYDILNAHEDIACERCYAPWGDAEKEMRAAGEALYALESGDALDQFDIVAFSLMHEMVYTKCAADAGSGWDSVLCGQAR